MADAIVQVVDGRAIVQFSGPEGIASMLAQAGSAAIGASADAARAEAARDQAVSVASRPIRTVVIIGSSNGAGMGSSTYAGDPSGPNWSSPSTSWAGLLETALKSRDSSWRVINRSISGASTQSSVARFYTDVAPHNPTHVILCNHPGNDGFDVQATRRWTLAFATMCESIGAMPILRGGYPYPGIADQAYKNMLALNAILDQSGYHRIDHMSVLDDGAGHFLNASLTTTDGLHLTDVGQRLFFNCIDQSLFLYGATKPSLQDARGAWKLVGTTGEGMYLDGSGGVVQSPLDLTVRFRARAASGAATPVALWGADAQTTGANSRLRVRSGLSGVIELVRDGGAVAVASTIPAASDGLMHEYVVTLRRTPGDPSTGAVALYIDGVLIGTDTLSNLYTTGVGPMFFGSAPGFLSSGWEFSGASVWVIAKPAAEVLAMYKSGRPRRASQLIECDFSAGPYNASSSPTLGVPNLVNNGMALTQGRSQWAWA